MADDATRIIALERLLQRTRENHKKELDRLHRRIRQLEGKPQKRRTNDPNIDPDTGKPISGWGIDHDRSHA